MWSIADWLLLASAHQGPDPSQVTAAGSCAQEMCIRDSSGIIVAAALAAVVEHSILGSYPVFHLQGNYTLTNSSSLVGYALLGLLAAVVSVAFTDSLIAVRAWFRRLTGVPRWVQPAIGGAATGGMAVAALSLIHI